MKETAKTTLFMVIENVQLTACIYKSVKTRLRLFKELVYLSLTKEEIDNLFKPSIMQPFKIAR